MLKIASMFLLCCLVAILFVRMCYAVDKVCAILTIDKHFSLTMPLKTLVIQEPG